MTILLTMMEPSRRFELVYSRQAMQHLRAIDRRHYGLIRAKIEEQLQFEPTTETRNRKPLKGSAAHDAEWEIGFGPNNRFRVFYEVDRERAEVWILAIGVKIRNRLIVGGEVFE